MISTSDFSMAWLTFRFPQYEVEAALRALSPYFTNENDATTSLRVALERLEVRYQYLKESSSIIDFMAFIKACLAHLQTAEELAHEVAVMGGADGARAIFALNNSTKEKFLSYCGTKVASKMNSSFPWINSEINLFNMTTGAPLWLKDVSVSEVKWLKDDPRKGVKAVVTLWEPLKDSTFLLELAEGKNLIFDLTRQPFGPRDLYLPDMVVASMTDCEILSKWIEDLVIVAPDLQGVVGVLVQMWVKFKLVLKGSQP